MKLSELKVKYGTIVKLPIPIYPNDAGNKDTATFYFRLPNLGEWLKFENNKTNKLALFGLIESLLIHQDKDDVEISEILDRSELLALNILNKIVSQTNFPDNNKLFDMYESARDLLYTTYHQLMQFILSVCPIYKITELKQMSSEELIELATFAEALSRRPFYVEWIIKGNEYAKAYSENAGLSEDEVIYDYDTHIKVKRAQFGLDDEAEQQPQKTFIDSETGRMIRGNPAEYAKEKARKKAELLALRNNRFDNTQNNVDNSEYAAQMNAMEEHSPEDALTNAAANVADRTLRQQLEREKSLRLQGITKQKHFDWSKEKDEP